ncbi:UNVERIFIED_CONTAM: hypothetical protein LBW93_04615 [Wolbachia endosymbiont of Nasonia longicornis]
MPILQQNALVTIYLKAFLLTITSINTSYATKPYRRTAKCSFGKLELEREQMFSIEKLIVT